MKMAPNKYAHVILELRDGATEKEKEEYKNAFINSAAVESKHPLDGFTPKMLDQVDEVDLYEYCDHLDELVNKYMDRSHVVTMAISRKPL